MDQRTCETCAALFTARAAGKPQRFCSSRCRHVAKVARSRQRAKERANRPASITCQTCGVDVPCQPIGILPKYCSNRCKKIANTTSEKVRECNQRFRARHPGYHAERQRAYRDKDPERSRAACRRYYASHADQWERYRDRSHLFRPEDLTYTTWVKVAARFAMWGDKCWMCGAAAEARDHVKPLSKGGRHLPSNIRPICHSCNSRKNNTWPVPTSPAWAITADGRAISHSLPPDAA